MLKKELLGPYKRKSETLHLHDVTALMSWDSDGKPRPTNVTSCRSLNKSTYPLAVWWAIIFANLYMLMLGLYTSKLFPK